MTVKKDADPNQFIKWLSDMLMLITNHGFWKIIEALLIICFAIGIFTIALNPDKVFDEFVKWYEHREIENREFRKMHDPLIKSEMQKTVYELGAIRASVLEFHNGKENPSGLGFLYVDMTYDVERSGYASVVSQYQDVNLSWLNLPSILYEDGYWYGTIDELKAIDSKLGAMMEHNSVAWASFLLLSGSQDLGILAITFDKEPDNVQCVGKSIRRLGVQIASMLDYENRS